MNSPGRSALDPFGSDEQLRGILTTYRTWAIVGLSGDPWRAAFGVAEFLISVGKQIVPVHPSAPGPVLGQQVYPRLADIPFPIDVVDVFRRSEFAGIHADEAVAIGASAVWFQLGVVDAEAYRRTLDAGLAMVMNACPHREWPRLIGE